MDIEWTRPVETYGELKGYRVRYGHRGQKLTEILVRGSSNYYCLRTDFPFSFWKNVFSTEFFIACFFNCINVNFFVR